MCVSTLKQNQRCASGPLALVPLLFGIGDKKRQVHRSAPESRLYFPCAPFGWMGWVGTGCRRSLCEGKKRWLWSLGETHGYCVLQRFAPQRRDACPSPDVTVRGTTELRRAGHVRRTRQGCGYHPGESGLVEVWLQAGSVRRHVG